jgi:3-hydroxyisobutyrate dehydrogenase-like beta-hydroxyacid dehydrogenase
MTTTRPTIGWLGTGRMGAAMARRLVDAGHDVAVWNRTRSKTNTLVEGGASAVATIHDLAARNIVFIMVSTPADLDEVVTGADGLLTASAKPAVIVDCSTVSLDSSAHIRAAATAAGVAFVAAPISGNPHVVAAGGACIVASGPAAAFDAAKPFLEQIAKVAVYAGEQEQSRLVKLCTNLYLGMMVQALVEVTSLAEKGGTDRAAFLDFLNATVLTSEWVRRRTPDLVKRDWTPTFTTELLRKDFDLGLGSARALEVPMPIGSAVYQLIQSAIAVGLGNDDFLSLYDQQARVAGLDAATSDQERS